MQAVRPIEPEKTSSLPSVDMESRVEQVTPERAREWLFSYRYPFQRPLSKGHVARLARALARHELRPGTLEFARCPEGVFLTDGQHRLSAVAHAEISQTFVVADYRYASMEGVHHHYTNTDNGRQRLGRDAPLWQLFAAEVGLDTVESKAVFAAMGILALGFTGVRPYRKGQVLTIEDRVELGETFKDAIRSYHTLCADASENLKRHLRNSAVVARALVTIAEQPDKAKRFWEAVATNRYEQYHDGIWWLLDRFMGRSTERYTTVEFAKVVSICWNAYFEGETRNAIRGIYNETPIRFFGTRYNGQKHRFLCPHLAPPE